jgi:NADH-quinone oxidoreductase subunit L
VNPFKAFSRFLGNVVEKSGIDALVNGVGKGINYGSRQIRLLQSGLVGSYILLMVAGLLLLLIIQLFTK